jgi:hypothetical protein
VIDEETGELANSRIGEVKPALDVPIHQFTNSPMHELVEPVLA